MKLLLSPVFSVFFCVLVTVFGHYNLKHPAPYNDFQCSPASKNDPICGPGCPPILSSGIQKAHNSPATPSAVWRRGQNVRIEWHRNNHEGGFYRRSLVPVDNMFDNFWHQRTAFGWGCWSQGTFLCGGPPASGSCGTDLRGLAYSNNMTVPAVFPNGDDVFAMVWYGGIDLPKRVPFFPDYYTCAFVRIEGGLLPSSAAAVFIPGFNKIRHASVPKGTCESASSIPAECDDGHPCMNNDVLNGVPAPFRNGQTPAPLQLTELFPDSQGLIDGRNKSKPGVEEATPSLEGEVPALADATPSPEPTGDEEVGDSLNVLEMQILQSMLLILVVLWLARDCLFPVEL